MEEVNFIMDTGASTTQKICFKVFCNEQKAKMQTKYPFLQKSQINQKMKELWKKMDTAEKMCYTKTILSPPKFKRNAQVNNLQTGIVAQKTNRTKGPRGKSHAVPVQTRVGNDNVFSVLKQNEHRTEMNTESEIEQMNTDSQIEHRTEKKAVSDTNDLKDNVNANSDTTSKKMPNAQKMPGRETVPWKGRPNKDKTDLWSDSSSPDRSYGEKTKISKKKKAQGILKPNGDTPRHRAKNRVSFGNLPSASPSPANFGDCNAGDSDDDGVQLLHRTDEDLYDFEKIARYDLCVEEDNYARPKQPLLNKGIQQTGDKITEFQIPEKKVTKRKLKEGENSQDETVVGVSPLTEGSSHNTASPLMTPQMDEYVIPQKLAKGTKILKSSLKVPPITESASRGKIRHHGSRKRNKSYNKRTSESDSLSDSFPDSDSTASQESQDRLERNMQLLSEKLFNLENAGKTFSSETDDSKSESQSSVNTLSASTLPPQRKRKDVQNNMKNNILKDFSSPNTNSDSSVNLKRRKTKKSDETPELQKNKATLTSSLSIQGKDTGSERTKQTTDGNKQQSKESQKITSPVPRMDADILISESPQKIIDQNFFSGGPPVYFNDNLSNDSDSSSTVVDREQTNKVLMSAILRMQRAVQYQDTSDAEASSPSLSGISQLSSVADESISDSTIHNEEMVREACTETEIQDVQSIREQSGIDNTNNQGTKNSQDQHTDNAYVQSTENGQHQHSQSTENGQHQHSQGTENGQHQHTDSQGTENGQHQHTDSQGTENGQHQHTDTTDSQGTENSQDQHTDSQGTENGQHQHTDTTDSQGTENGQHQHTDSQGTENGQHQHTDSRGTENGQHQHTDSQGTENGQHQHTDNANSQGTENGQHQHTDNTDSQGTENGQDLLQTHQSSPSQMENEDQDCKELDIMDVPKYREKEMCFPDSSTNTRDFGEDEEDVFQMFSKISPPKAKNIQGRRFITSSRHEGRSNFTDLFHDKDIF